MYKKLYLILFSIALISFQCTGDQATTEDQTEASEAASEQEPTMPKIVAQPPPESNRSASEIFEANADRYAQLYQVVSKNLDNIRQRIDGESFPERLKDGLKASYEEVANYKTIEEISQTSKYTSAETVEQFMEGLEMYLDRWGMK